MQKKVHEKRSSSEMLPQSFPHPRISMVSSTSLRKAYHHSGGEKRKSEIWRTCKKSFLVHDDEYNSMIYEWRKLATAPIVKVFMVSKDHDIDGRTG
jgi:ABC-type lipopolysaccharide export system ATPase subunit